MCDCDIGYTGYDCSLQTNNRPTFDPEVIHQVCPSECPTVELTGNGFYYTDIDPSQLKCRLTSIEVRLNMGELVHKCILANCKHGSSVHLSFKHWSFVHLSYKHGSCVNLSYKLWVFCTFKTLLYHTFKLQT